MVYVLLIRETFKLFLSDILVLILHYVLYCLGASTFIRLLSDDLIDSA